MSLGRLLLDVWLALLVLSLASVALIFLAWLVIPFAAVASARRRSRRSRPDRGGLERLAEACSQDALAEIDEALEAILVQEQPRFLTRKG